jgi:GDP-4-dehydro-6-deoxy-D-mannose reductase
MRALVTGHTGFTGGFLTKYLEAKGYEWSGLSSRDGDIRDQQLLGRVIHQTRPDVFFHLAAGHRDAGQEEQRSIAVDGTTSLLRAAADAAPASRIVIVSSSAVYGEGHAGRPIAETAAVRPVTIYGTVKLAQEVAAKALARSAGIRMLVVRPFNLVGPGQPKSLAIGAFVEQLVHAEQSQGEAVIRVGNTLTTRDFVDVRDAVHAYELLGRIGRPLAAYNICSGQGVTIAACLDRLIKFALVPVRVERSIDRAVGHDVAFQVGDPRRTLARTGWRPQIPLDQSLRDVLAYRRQLGR